MWSDKSNQKQGSSILWTKETIVTIAQFKSLHLWWYEDVWVPVELATCVVENEHSALLSRIHVISLANIRGQCRFTFI